MTDETKYHMLIRRILEGDQQAYSELYDVTIKQVYKNVHFLLESKEEIDDVIQDIYLEVFKSLGRFDKQREFNPWLMGLVIRQIQSYRKKRWTRLRIIKKAFENNVTITGQIFNCVDQFVTNDELIRLIEQLPFKQKQVVILHYLNDYSQEEVAEILQIPIGTVKSRIHAALGKLRKKGLIQNLLLEEAGNEV
ncbi:sigma-70 family RNA polymerase sigma factor [Halalkalibacter akibai]|uniref:RNA polymerase sigma-70 factor n=1 Tax=Halalkalibacter akibai (strain ATCC 43226 / DSM 21942 / CIP 109018 / JCM 9157 / 1139) TaxID=1236973 RepID=W4QPG9_HALA3|nr:sigma-70 family RNA polymerase sigma factor [Halalkalibacter akibai]GAE33995.1 RNA polymerase sigma-70 factor [Halalkalibacter akibai JCM 9157]